jgi:hypothetical protein
MLLFKWNGQRKRFRLSASAQLRKLERVCAPEEKHSARGVLLVKGARAKPVPAKGAARPAAYLSGFSTVAAATVKLPYARWCASGTISCRVQTLYEFRRGEKPLSPDKEGALALKPKVTVEDA